MIPLNEVVSFIFHQSSVVASDVCVGILFQNERRPYASYMESQPEINEKMRATLVDWLVLVHTKYEFSLETLYLTINIIDRYSVPCTPECAKEGTAIGRHHCHAHGIKI